MKHRSKWWLVLVLSVLAAIPAALVWHELGVEPQPATAPSARERGWTGDEVGEAIRHHRAEAPTPRELPGRTAGPVPESDVAPSPAAPRPGFIGVQ